MLASYRLTGRSGIRNFRSLLRSKAARASGIELVAGGPGLIGAPHLPSNGHIVSVTGQEPRGFAIMLWPLRVMGLLIVATLACAAAHTARAEPRPADACRRAAFRAIIDVGHTEQAPGATSARGVLEFVFNLNLASASSSSCLPPGSGVACS